MKRRTPRPAYTLALAAVALFAAGYALAAWIYRPITFHIEAHCVAPTGTTFREETDDGVEPPGAPFFDPRPQVQPNWTFPIKRGCWAGHDGVVTWGVTICQEEI